jgi:LEA14-like dessication related protein
MRKQVPLCATCVLMMLTAGCSQLQGLGLGARPRIKGVRPRISGIDFQGLSLAFDVDVENPYPVAIRSPRFRYGLDIEDAEFLKSDQETKIDLPARGVGTVTLPLRLNYLDLWRTYQRLGDAAEIDYTLRGAVLVAAGGQSFDLPLQHAGKFPVLRPPSFANIRVDTSDVSLSSAKVHVDADMHNPNVFDLGVRDVGYAVRLGDVQVGRIGASTLDALGPKQSGKLALTGEITGITALQQLLAGKGLGKPTIAPFGSVQTPYGAVKLPR